MKFYRSICDSLAILGISPSLSHQKYPINARILLTYVCYLLQIILHWIYLSQNALSFEEYSGLIFRIAFQCLIPASFTVYVIQGEKFFQCLDIYEQVIDESENRAKHSLHQLNHIVIN